MHAEMWKNGLVIEKNYIVVSRGAARLCLIRMLYFVDFLQNGKKIIMPSIRRSGIYCRTDYYNIIFGIEILLARISNDL